jgi:hypothetical protein
VTNDWSLDTSFQMQNGLPFTEGVSSFTSNGEGNYLNGSSGSTLIPQIGINTQRYPRHIVDDARLQKEISFEKGRNLQLMANMFNVANHQNITSYQSTAAYQLSKYTATYLGQPGTSNDTYRTVNNSNRSGFLYTPREIEISARFTF